MPCWRKRCSRSPEGPDALLRDISPHLALASVCQRQPRTSETLAERHQAIIARLNGLREAWLRLWVALTR